MTKNTKGKNLSARCFRTLVTGISTTSAAGRYKSNGELMNLRSQLEAIAGAGEEVLITKAILRVQLRTTVSFTGNIGFLVSDAAIAGADPGENTLVGNFDDDIDVMTAGDYESRNLVSFLAKEQPASSVFIYNGVLDVTDVVRKAAALLARSATLATNPYMSFVTALIASVANTTPTINCVLELWYNVGPKKLRMLA